MKKTVSSVFIILLVMLLCSCGNGEKSTGEVFNDFAEHCNEYGVLAYPDFEITNMSIVKRQTDPENRYDAIWLAVEGESDKFSYNGQFYMSYSLYNDGWMLETIYQDDEGEGGFIPKGPASQELADSFLAEYVAELVGLFEYTDLELVETDYNEESPLSTDFTYTYKARNEMYTETRWVRINAVFNVESGDWEIHDEKPYNLMRERHWTLEGIYYCGQIWLESYFVELSETDDEGNISLTAYYKGEAYYNTSFSEAELGADAWYDIEIPYYEDDNEHLPFRSSHYEFRIRDNYIIDGLTNYWNRQ